MKNIVLASFDSPHHDHCVDVFQRPDGSFGYEEFRRDVEDQGTWQSLSKYSLQIFKTECHALRAASKSVAWLSDNEAWLRYVSSHASPPGQADAQMTPT